MPGSKLSSAYPFRHEEKGSPHQVHCKLGVIKRYTELELRPIRRISDADGDAIATHRSFEESKGDPKVFVAR